MKMIFGTLVAIAFCLSAEAGQIAKSKCARDEAIPANVTIQSLADGDTVDIKAGAKVYAVRMIGIDTPETHYQGQSQGEWGEKAAARLRELLPVGTKVRLELSPTQCDMYGRVLAHIFVGKKNVNMQMAKEGLAVNYCLFPSVAYCEEIGALTGAAIKARIGMFSESDLELPYDFRRRVSGRHPTSFVGSTRTKKVLRPGNQEAVPVAERIFFGQESDVKPPYRVIN